MEDTNHTTHTKRRVIIFIVLLAAFLLIGLMADKEKKVTETPAAQIKQCYIWNTEAGDKATLVFTATGSQIMGDIAFLPAEKDKKTGDFAGELSVVTPDTGVIHGWWNASAEGMNAKEEVIITISGATAAVGFGEMKMQADGSYVYAEPTALSYAPTLQQTDCADPALQ